MVVVNELPCLRPPSAAMLSNKGDLPVRSVPTIKGGEALVPGKLASQVCGPVNARVPAGDAGGHPAQAAQAATAQRERDLGK